MTTVSPSNTSPNFVKVGKKQIEVPLSNANLDKLQAEVFDEAKIAEWEADPNNADTNPPIVQTIKEELTKLSPNGVTDDETANQQIAENIVTNLLPAMIQDSSGTVEDLLKLTKGAKKRPDFILDNSNNLKTGGQFWVDLAQDKKKHHILRNILIATEKAIPQVTGDNTPVMKPITDELSSNNPKKGLNIRNTIGGTLGAISLVTFTVLEPIGVTNFVPNIGGGDKQEQVQGGPKEVVSFIDNFNRDPDSPPPETSEVANTATELFLTNTNTNKLSIVGKDSNGVRRAGTDKLNVLSVRIQNNETQKKTVADIIYLANSEFEKAVVVIPKEKVNDNFQYNVTKDQPGFLISNDGQYIPFNNLSDDLLGKITTP